MLQPFVDALIPFMPGYLELPESYAGLLKGASHRYIKRVPKPGGGYRYFYHVGHGGTVGNADHFVPGASFRFEGGHYHIKSEEGGKLTIEHDETKERKTVSKTELWNMLRVHHDKGLTEHRTKVSSDLADARKAGASPKQIAKLEERAKAGARPKDELDALADDEAGRHFDAAEKAARVGDHDKAKDHKVKGWEAEHERFKREGDHAAAGRAKANADRLRAELAGAKDEPKAKPSRSDYKTKATQSSASKWDVEITLPDGKTKWERVGGERPIKDAAEARKVALDQYLGATGQDSKAKAPKADQGGSKATTRTVPQEAKRQYDIMWAQYENMLSTVSKSRAEKLRPEFEKRVRERTQEIAEQLVRHRKDARFNADVEVEAAALRKQGTSPETAMFEAEQMVMDRPQERRGMRRET